LTVALLPLTTQQLQLIRHQCNQPSESQFHDPKNAYTIRDNYADSHKNKDWQEHAAAVAAGFAKELLLIVPTQEVKQTPAIKSNRPSTSLVLFYFSLQVTRVSPYSILEILQGNVICVNQPI
jgi:hypothetical protein